MAGEILMAPCDEKYGRQTDGSTGGGRVLSSVGQEDDDFDECKGFLILALGCA